MAIDIGRRKLIAGLGSAAVASPLSVRAQQSDRVRRIGVLNSLAETDLDAQAWDAAFRKRLDEFGWIDGRNIHIDYCWGAGSVERLQLFAKELVRLNPDVLVAVTTPGGNATGWNFVHPGPRWLCSTVPHYGGRRWWFICARRTHPDGWA